MPRVIEGDPRAARGPFAIVVARYNQAITEKLLQGALDTFAQHGVDDQQLLVAWVPGAWELPVAAARLLRRQSFQAVVCLGAVIRGETTHDQYINQQISQSLGRMACEREVPVLFGVLTCNTLEQAIHRSGGNMGNKGAECAQAALEMADLMRQLEA